ncbi:MAG: LamG domain-containing protein [Exilibacterium sp.]
MVGARTIKLLCIVALAVSMTTGFTGCSSGSNSDNASNPDLTEPPATGGVVYKGPAEDTEDVKNFKINVWNNLAGENRCGGCHGSGGQAPAFVRDDDINLAYVAANSIVDLTVPSSSRMVEKVGGGHNCWESSASVCAEIITNYIEAWANVAGGASNVIVLQPLAGDQIRDPGETKFFPDSAAGFTPLWNLFRDPDRANCLVCHAEDGERMQQQPYFSSSDIATAYENAKSKMDLNNPANSRFVIRLKNEFHNCWENAAIGETCATNAATVQNLIQTFADSIETTAVDTDTLVVSKAVNLAGDGVLASSGGRNDTNAIALYEFKDKAVSTTAFDTSGVDPALNLNLSGEVEKLSSFGLRLSGGKAQASTTASRKLYDLISATGEYSLEAWVVPGNVTQEGPARIITYSGGDDIRNFTLGQSMYNYDFLNRSSATDGNGTPALSTDDDAEVLQATLQHVVATFDPLNGRRIYVNGEFTGDLDVAGGGNLADWDDSYALVLGSEVSNDYLWEGTVRLLAIYNRIMTDDQIQDNYEAGVGEKFFLMFSVSHLLDGISDAYVVFQVQVYDISSYLFSEPFFQILDPDADPGSIPIRGIRIGVNGREAPVGQAFANIDVTVNSADYAAEQRQRLSRLGAVMAVEQGPEQDEFFLTFDQFGTRSYNRPLSAAPVPNEPVDFAKQSRLGLRTFEEIDATFAKLTGVTRANANVQQVFATVKQQMPSVPNVDAFLSSHQMGIVQLAASYCGELVDDSALRAQVFPDFNFSADVSMAFSTQAGRDYIIDPLLMRLLTDYLPDVAGADLPPGSTLTGPQSLSAVTRSELDSLIVQLRDCSTCGTDSSRTQTIVKAACSTALSSAVMLLQ